MKLTIFLAVAGCILLLAMISEGIPCIKTDSLEQSKKEDALMERIVRIIWKLRGLWINKTWRLRRYEVQRTAGLYVAFIRKIFSKGTCE